MASSGTSSFLPCWPGRILQGIRRLLWLLCFVCYGLLALPRLTRRTLALLRHKIKWLIAGRKGSLGCGVISGFLGAKGLCSHNQRGRVLGGAVLLTIIIIGAIAITATGFLRFFLCWDTHSFHHNHKTRAQACEDQDNDHCILAGNLFAVNTIRCCSPEHPRSPQPMLRPWRGVHYVVYEATVYYNVI